MYLLSLPVWIFLILAVAIAYVKRVKVPAMPQAFQAPTAEMGLGAGLRPRACGTSPGEQNQLLARECGK